VVVGGGGGVLGVLQTNTKTTTPQPNPPKKNHRGGVGGGGWGGGGGRGGGGGGGEIGWGKTPPKNPNPPNHPPPPTPTHNTHPTPTPPPPTQHTPTHPPPSTHTPPPKKTQKTTKQPAADGGHHYKRQAASGSRARSHRAGLSAPYHWIVLGVGCLAVLRWCWATRCSEESAAVTGRCPQARCAGRREVERGECAIAGDDNATAECRTPSNTPYASCPPTRREPALRRPDATDVMQHGAASRR